MMPQRHRLRGLEVREARHDGGGMLASAAHQRLLQGLQTAFGTPAGFAHPHPEIGGDLVVATARGVEPPRRRAD